MDLESIHDNLPSLKSLDLQAEPIPYTFPHDIKPALLVPTLKLDMEYDGEFDTHIQLYNYMSKKYPSLSTFILDDEAIGEENDEDLQTLFESGLFPFFQSIQSQILSFTLSNYYDEMNLFKKFDEFAWKLQELKLAPPFNDHHLFGEIAQSKQSKYIQKLTLMDCVCSPINLLSNMQVLTSLNLDYHHAYKSTDNNVNLSELIEYSPPTLTHLTLSNINLLFNGSTLKHSSITHLNIKYTMSPLLTELLATYFPKLSVFHYYGGVNGKYTIALPNHDLEEFEVIISFPKNQTTKLSIKSTCGDTVQYRALKQGGDTPGGFVGVTKEEFDDMSTSNKLTFVCASVKKMTFSTYQY
jgi:hypothetical protein